MRLDNLYNQLAWYCTSAFGARKPFTTFHRSGNHDQAESLDFDRSSRNVSYPSSGAIVKSDLYINSCQDRSLLGKPFITHVPIAEYKEPRPY